MKRIVIFGSTGPTGLCCVRTALEKGLEVRAFTRDKTKIPEDLRDKIEIVVGHVTNAKDVAKAVAGRDAVIVTLGYGTNLGPNTELSKGMQNIIDSMKAHKVELISACLSMLLFNLETVPFRYKYLTEEHQRMFEIIKSSGSKWVVICPPYIVDKPKSNYIIAINCSAWRAISKYDLGEFLIKCLENPDYYQKMLGIANTS
ncbi:flavin reductase (NADPH) [Solenopsis invicta]|uniref:flavin reductase (NADPH) n=1 Tax=Solenopsis invicta TaxID=13686 RepID=UPI000E33DC31|nr:flavin reductase (NADPH) [Solenopsis invicta]